MREIKIYNILIYSGCIGMIALAIYENNVAWIFTALACLLAQFFNHEIIKLRQENIDLKEENVYIKRKHIEALAKFKMLADHVPANVVKEIEELE